MEAPYAFMIFRLLIKINKLFIYVKMRIIDIGFIWNFNVNLFSSYQGSYGCLSCG
jgi:hypothetical protein